jgi:dodecin
MGLRGQGRTGRQAGACGGRRAERRRLPGAPTRARETPTEKGTPMTDRTYKRIDIVGTSPDGVDQAIRNGLSKAAQTVRHLDWFEVDEIRGHLQEGEIGHFQVVMKVGFRIDEE